MTINTDALEKSLKLMTKRVFKTEVLLGVEGMNQFKKYEEQLKDISEAWKIANDFDYILNNIWCVRSFHKGKGRWMDIIKIIPQPFKTSINVEMEHVYLGHGIEQARAAVKSEMNKYIEYLLEKNQ